MACPGTAAANAAPGAARGRVFVDIDGTLADERHIVPESSKESCRGTQVNGHLLPHRAAVGGVGNGDGWGASRVNEVHETL